MFTHQTTPLPTASSRSSAIINSQTEGIFQQYYLEGMLNQLLHDKRNRTTESYKLHVGIGIDNYHHVLAAIQAILFEAMKEDKINTFKMVNPEFNMHDSLQRSRDRQVSEEERKTEIKAKNRVYNNPIIIYIPQDANPDVIFDLCQSLEKN